jgi:ATP-dependent protease HslVU (ClpYQ) ATPase subunit
MGKSHVEINAAYVKQRLDEISKDEDLSKFIL